MEFLSKVLPELISRLLSLIQASRLRHEYYEILEEHEIMWTALDDVARMAANTPAGEHARRTQQLINAKHRSKHKAYKVGDDIR